jgi:hypothetical protein
MNPIIFDIETAPLPDSAVDRFKPEFEARRNYCDPNKIKADIAEKEADWRDKLALSPLTGRVLCIGWLDGDEFHTIEGEEVNILTGFWNLTAHLCGRQFAGHNILAFDLPFIMRRSWAVGLRVPASDFDGHRLSPRFVDTMKLWACGVYGERVSLDYLSKHLGVGEKNGNGKNFAALYDSDRKAALAYLENDCRLTAKAIQRML